MDRAMYIIIAGVLIVAVGALYIYVIQPMLQDVPAPPGSAPYAVVTYMDAPSNTRAGSTADITAKIKNTGGQEATFLVEAGVIPKTVAESWGFLSFIPFLSTTQNLGQCCAGQHNVWDQYVVLGPGEESDLLTFRLTVPYDGIEDRCGDTEYWVGCNWLSGGPEYYVSYISTHSGCWTVPGRVNYGFRTKGMAVTCS